MTRFSPPNPLAVPSISFLALAALLAAAAGCSDTPQPAEKTGPGERPAVAGENAVTLYGVWIVQGDYLGLETPEAAFRQALEELPWAVPETLTYDDQSREFRFHDSRKHTDWKELDRALMRFGFGTTSSIRELLPSPQSAPANLSPVTAAAPPVAPPKGTFPSEPRTVESRGIITARVRKYRGHGDAEAAVQAVLRQIPWVIAESAVYDEKAGFVRFYHDAKRGPSVNTRIVEIAIGGAGFDYLSQSYRQLSPPTLVSIGPEGVTPSLDPDRSPPNSSVVASAAPVASQATPAPHSPPTAAQQPETQASFGSSGLKLEADPLPSASRSLPDRPIMIALPAPNVRVAMPSTPSPLAALGVSGYAAVNGRSTQVWRWECWDLTVPRRLSALQAPMTLVNTDTGLSPAQVLSGDGRLLAVQRQINARDPDQNAKIDLYSFESGTMQQTFDLQERARVLFTGFAGPDHLLTVQQYWPAERPPDLHRRPELLRPKVRRWSISSGEVLNEFGLQVPNDQTGPPTAITLSPAGRYLAVVQRHLWVHEASTGQLAAQAVIPRLERTHNPKPGKCLALTFTDDGASLAGLFKPFGEDIRLIAWDVVAGKLHGELGLGPEHEYSATVSTPPGRHRLNRLPDGLGWTLLAETIVDDPSARTLWQAKRETATRPRWMPDNTHLAEIRRINQSMTLVVAPLPLHEIRERQQRYRASGWEEDIALPPIVRPQEQYGKTVPWPDAPAPLELEYQPTPAPSRPFSDGAIQIGESPVAGVYFARPDVGQAVAWRGTLRDTAGEALFTRPEAEEENQLVRVDLFTGEQLGRLELPSGSAMLGISPDGTLAVTRSGDSFTRVDVWSLTDGTHFASWRPYTSGAQPEEEISRFKIYPSAVLWAGFPDSEHLITLQAETGEAIVWTLDQPSAVARFSSGVSIPPVFSPDHRYLLFDQGERVRILDCRDWRTVGDLLDLEDEPLERGYLRQFAFHPHKPLLAGLSTPRGSAVGWTRVWDLRSGKRLTETLCRKTYEPPRWGPDGCLWVQQGWGPFELLDPSRHAVVYRFSASETISQLAASDSQGSVWLRTHGDTDRPVFLKRARVPKQQTLDEIEAGVPLDRKPIFGRGTKASIVVQEFNVSGDAEGARKRVVETIESQLRSIGVEPASGQPVRVLVNVRRGKGSEEQYVTGSRTKPATKVTVTRDRYNCSVAVLDGNDTHVWGWRTSVLAGASMPWYEVPAGKDPQDHLREMTTKFGAGSVMAGLAQLTLPEQLHAPIVHGPAKVPGLGTKTFDLSLPPTTTSRNSSLARYQQIQEKRDWLLPLLGGAEALPDPSTQPQMLGVSAAPGATAAGSTPTIGSPIGQSTAHGAPYPGFAPETVADLQKAARDYRRSVYLELIAGEDAAVIDRLRWMPGGKRPAIGIRWGVGIHWTAPMASPQIRSLDQFVQLTGTIGQGIFQEINQRIQEGEFGKWPESDDPGIGPPVFLGLGDDDELRDRAQRHVVDAIAIIELTTRGSGARAEPALQIRLMDTVAGEILYRSSVTRRSALQGPALAELGRAFQEALDTQFSLTAMPSIRPEHARSRIAALAGMVEAMPLSTMLELRYYLAKNLITPNDAVPLLDRILGHAQGSAFLDADEPTRRRLLTQWNSPP